jgi:hypothetical protein
MAKRKRPKGQKTIYKTLHRKIKNIVFFFFLNEPFAHSLYDSNILHFYTSYFLYSEFRGRGITDLPYVDDRLDQIMPYRIYIAICGILIDCLHFSDLILKLYVLYGLFPFYVKLNENNIYFLIICTQCQC